MTSRATFFAALVVAVSATDSPAAVLSFQVHDYRQRSDSPWKSRIESGSFYQEDFLAGELGTRTFVSPYIASPAGFKGYASGYHSVDGDDGIIDEFGRFGGSYVAGATLAPDGTSVSFRFDFTSNEVGSLPLAAGLVVTNAATNALNSSRNRTVVSMFNAEGRLIHSYEILDLPASIVEGMPGHRAYYTNGARFFGFSSDIGIASITISGALSVDHVQYGFEQVPEPSLLLLISMAGLAFFIRR